MIMKQFPRQRGTQKRINYYSFQYKNTDNKIVAIRIPASTKNEAKSILKQLKDFKEAIKSFSFLT